MHFTYYSFKNMILKYYYYHSTIIKKKDVPFLIMVFENHRKSLIQYCERSELRLLLSGQKLIKNAKNGPF